MFNILSQELDHREALEWLVIDVHWKYARLIWMLSYTLVDIGLYPTASYYADIR